MRRRRGAKSVLLVEAGQADSAASFPQLLEAVGDVDEEPNGKY